MTIIEIILIGIGLAMDAFAASICKGLSLKKLTLNNILIIALYFSIFQSIMPLLGYILGTNFNNFLLIINHLISFTILTMIGLNMIIESLSKQEKEISSIINFKTMIPLSFATSIDAFTVGINSASDFTYGGTNYSAGQYYLNTSKELTTDSNSTVEIHVSSSTAEYNSNEFTWNLGDSAPTFTVNEIGVPTNQRTIEPSSGALESDDNSATKVTTDNNRFVFLLIIYPTLSL